MYGTLCQAVLFLMYIVATKMWICHELELWHIIHVLVFITQSSEITLVFPVYKLMAFLLISGKSQVWSVFRWDVNVDKPGKSFMPPMKACLPWLNSYRCHRYLYARLWKYLSSYCKLVQLFLWILFMWYQKMTVLCMFDLGMKELLNLLQRCRVGRAG